MKPSEIAPSSGKIIAEIISELNDDRYKVIQGGVETAVAITQIPFDLIIYTGSTEKGKLVARAASENLVPCILELGGKSPIIIDEGCDLEWAANRTIFG